MSFTRLFENCVESPELMLVGLGIVAVLYVIAIVPGSKVPRD